MEPLTGKVALVTGGVRGIGRAISLALARAGADFAVNYRERREGADSAVREIRDMGRRAIAIQSDVSRGAEVTRLARAVESQFGPIAAQAGSIVGVHYAASKAGMLGLTRSYARALAKEGITVNAITPALIATEMVLSNPVAKPEMIPVGRFGDIEEVADVALMLARNAYITGQTINVNGGYYMS